MKIAIDVRTLMEKQCSGVPEYTRNLTNEILKLDQENEYRLFYNSMKSLDVPDSDFFNGGFSFVKKNYPNRLLNFSFKFFNRPRLDKMLGADVFFAPHINFTAFTVDSLSGILSEKKKIKKILTIHDLSFLRFPEFFSFKRNLWHYFVNVRNLVNKFDIIVAVSENTKRDIMELCDVRPEKIKVVPSGLDASIFGGDRSEELRKSVKDKYNLPDKFILFLGTVEPRKNIEGLIGAYNLLRNHDINFSDYKLVIAGYRGWKSKNIFHAGQISRYKNDIKFIGPIAHKEKFCLYSSADVFVYPSFYEGFGFPPLEAMASGTPVVTSFSSSLPEVVGNAAVMVDPFDITEIAMGIRQVLTNKNLRVDMTEKGKKRAANFSWEKAASEYIKIFSE